MSNKQIYSNLFNQVMNLWVKPEIEKRKKENQLPQDFRLKAIQVIFSMGSHPLIRFNNEVKALIRIKPKRKISKGKLVYENDVQEVKELELIDDERDFGHITIIRFNKDWVLGFSFIYDTSKSKRFLELGSEYLRSAEKDYQNGLFRPMIESLSVAAENFAKARLFLLPDKEIRKAKKHGLIRSKVNIYSKTSDIVGKEFKGIFNELQDTRDKARYNPNYSIAKNEARKMIQVLREMSVELSKWISFRIK